MTVCNEQVHRAQGEAAEATEDEKTAYPVVHEDDTQRTYFDWELVDDEDTGEDYVIVDPI